MTLFEKLKDIIGLGYVVKFSSVGFQFQVIIEIEIDGLIVSKESWLPLQDHFYEKKIVDCIDWMISEIKSKNNSLT